MANKLLRNFSFFALVMTVMLPVAAQQETSTQTIEIKSKRNDLQGIADSASEGVVSQKQIANRPLMRTGDLLEVVPGLVSLQHAGEGHANQYFLRGFSLDHGTDFATYVDGVLINMPSHGHGQGYTDINFLIPELIESIRFRKGPYSAEDGDFASAGSARFRTVRSLDAPLGVLQLGSFGYKRVMAAVSQKLDQKDFLIALEQARDSGPWEVDQQLRKNVLFAKLSSGSYNHGWSMSVSHHKAAWISTDPIPERAVKTGLIGRFGSLDPTVGGATQRTGFIGEWADTKDGDVTKVTAYATQYAFNLFSNTTYFTRGCDFVPLASNCNGAQALDQFEQTDKRQTVGLNANKTFAISNDKSLTFGSEVRRDNIGTLGLYDTFLRQRLNTTSLNKVELTALAITGQLETQHSPVLRSVIGMRWDYRHAGVTNLLLANASNVNANLLSPKATISYSPTKNTDWYGNVGRGFHSNDARGAVSVNQPSPLLVKTTGFEFGTRQKVTPNLQVTAALWQMNLDSELLYLGDAGTTAPSRPTTRRGVEITSSWRPSATWEIDGNLSFNRARFRDYDPVGSYVPNAINQIVSAGVTYTDGPFTVGAKLRFISAHPLIEDNSIRSSPHTVVNLRTSYRLNKQLEISMDVFNVFNTKASDTEYAYASRLANEAAFSSSTPATLHFHPALPRMLRIGMRLGF
jgi:outer membrane receptor protein involved in Fe transport